MTAASFPVAGSVRPHALTGTATTAGMGTAADAPLPGAGTYGYDAVGNLASRTVPKVGGGSTAQALAWDVEGHLSSVTEEGKGAVTSSCMTRTGRGWSAASRAGIEPRT